MKRKLLILATLLSTIFVGAHAFEITSANGWLESAAITWTPKNNADSYNVYYSGEGIDNQKIDNQLIRSYGHYFRADLLGLAAGNYTIKVAPVIEGVEQPAIQSNTINVQPYNRSGFAFSNGRVPGAYNLNGTLKSGAVILYITENTKNTITMDVTGANANPCVGLQEILDGFKKGNDNRPLAVRFVGQITDLDYMLAGDIVVENKKNSSSHITLEGVGNDAVIDGWGIRIKSATNIEIRNLGFMNCDSNEGDNISLQQDNEYIWVHNCDLFYGHAGSDSDQQKGDGALDVKKSTYITLSYNHFWDTGKSNLLGLGEGTTQGLYITYHHNWYDHSDSRHPRVRYYSAHVYNNYYDGISKYGVGATLGSSVFVEANYFRNARYPMLISMQGTDTYYNSPTFSSENGGIIKAYNNHIEGERRFVPYNETTDNVDFDAYVATTRNEQVPTTVKTRQGAHTYNNFDTNSSIMYNYTPDSPQDAKTNVMQYAGRMFGGDFSWTFNNAIDDNSYAVNTALKAALTSYTTQLVAIQGDNPENGGGNNEPTNPDQPGEINPSDLIHNFTLSGLNSTFYNIAGNLSTSKGTVVYNGLTLTQCLKLESTTSVKFTTNYNSTLTLILNNDFNNRVKINNVNHTAQNGEINVELEPGTHEINKADVANLFYIKLEQNNGVGISNPTLNTPLLHPNPVQSTLHIDSKITINKVEVYTLTGTLIKRHNGNTSQINLSHLPHGSYLVVIHTPSAVHKQIIIKK